MWHKTLTHSRHSTYTRRSVHNQAGLLIPDLSTATYRSFCSPPPFFPHTPTALDPDTMTISFSPYDASLTVQFSQMVEFKLYPWFDEAFTAHAHLDYPVYGVNESIEKLFPGYVSPADPSLRVFAATLDFSGPDHGVPKQVCVKIARGVDEVVRLSHEASIYRKQLVKVWGIAVPTMYGFFIGHHDDDPVACLMLDLCDGPNAPLRDAERFMCVPTA